MQLKITSQGPTELANDGLQGAKAIVLYWTLILPLSKYKAQQWDKSEIKLKGEL